MTYPFYSERPHPRPDHPVPTQPVPDIGMIANRNMIDMPVLSPSAQEDAQPRFPVSDSYVVSRPDHNAEGQRQGDSVRDIPADVTKEPLESHSARLDDPPPPRQSSVNPAEGLEPSLAQSSEQIRLRGTRFEVQEDSSQPNDASFQALSEKITHALRSDTDLEITFQNNKGRFTVEASDELLPPHPIRDVATSEETQPDPPAPKTVWARMHLRRTAEPLEKNNAEGSDRSQDQDPSRMDMGAIISHGPRDVEMNIYVRAVPRDVEDGAREQNEVKLHNASETAHSGITTPILQAVQNVLDVANRTALGECVVTIGAQTPIALEAAVRNAQARILPHGPDMQWRAERTDGSLVPYPSRDAARRPDVLTPTDLVSTDDVTKLIAYPKTPLPGYVVQEKTHFAFDPNKPVSTDSRDAVGYVRIADADGNITDDRLRIPRDEQRRNSLLVASSGWGKSAFIRNAVREALTADYIAYTRAEASGQRFIVPRNLIIEFKKESDYTDRLSAELDAVVLDGHEVPALAGQKLPEAMRTIEKIDLASEEGIRVVLGLMRLAGNDNHLRQRENLVMALAASQQDPIAQGFIIKYGRIVYDALQEARGIDMETGRPRYGTEEPPKLDLHYADKITQRIVDKFGFSKDASGDVSGFVRGEIQKLLRGMPALLFGEGHEFNPHTLFNQIVDALRNGVSPEAEPTLVMQFKNVGNEGLKRTALFALYTSLISTLEAINGGDVNHTMLRLWMDETGGIFEGDTPVSIYLAGIDEISRGMGIEKFMAQQGGADRLSPRTRENTANVYVGQLPDPAARAVIAGRMPGATKTQIDALASIHPGTGYYQGTGYGRPVQFTFPHPALVPRGEARVLDGRRYVDLGHNQRPYEHAEAMPLARQFLLEGSPVATRLRAVAELSTSLVLSGRAPVVMGEKLLGQLRNLRLNASPELRDDIRESAVVKTVELAVSARPWVGSAISQRELIAYVSRNILSQINPGEKNINLSPRMDLTYGTGYYSAVLDRLRDRMTAAREEGIDQYERFLGIISGSDAEEQRDSALALRSDSVRAIATVIHGVVQRSRHMNSETPRINNDELEIAATNMARLTGASVSRQSVQNVQKSIEEQSGATFSDALQTATLQRIADAAYHHLAKNATDAPIPVASFDDVIRTLDRAIVEAAMAPNVDLSAFEAVYGEEFLSAVKINPETNEQYRVSNFDVITAAEQKKHVMELLKVHVDGLPYEPSPVINNLFAPDYLNDGLTFDNLGAALFKEAQEKGIIHERHDDIRNGGSAEQISYLTLIESDDPRAQELLTRIVDNLFYNEDIVMTPGSRKFLVRHLLFHLKVIRAKAANQSIDKMSEPEM